MNMRKSRVQAGVRVRSTQQLPRVPIKLFLPQPSYNCVLTPRSPFSPRHSLVTAHWKE